MSWYSVFHPSLLDSAVIKYIKEVWHFNKNPLLVVLDPHGKIVNTNALPMVWIWGSSAFPFTSLREEALWNEEKWGIELLVGSIEPMIFNWALEGKYICLYGGEDIEWTRSFTTTAQAVAQAARIPLELLYVGKSNPREKICKINTTIVNDGLGHEIMKMLSFDGNNQGWAVVSRGSDEMAKAKGDTIWKSLVGFEQWKDQAHEKGFLPTLIDNLNKLHTLHHCNHLILPGTTTSIPETVVCVECGKVMEKFIMYRCCSD